MYASAAPACACALPTAPASSIMRASCRWTHRRASSRWSSTCYPAARTPPHGSSRGGEEPVGARHIGCAGRLRTDARRAAPRDRRVAAPHPRNRPPHLHRLRIVPPQPLQALRGTRGGRLRPATTRPAPAAFPPRRRAAHRRRQHRGRVHLRAAPAAGQECAPPLPAGTHTPVVLASLSAATWRAHRPGRAYPAACPPLAPSRASRHRQSPLTHRICAPPPPRTRCGAGQ